MKSAIVIMAGSLLAVSSSAFAGQSVTLHFAQSKGYFYCVINDSDPSSTVNIDTKHINVNGFCKGRPYVSGAGHIDHMPSETVNKVAFGYKDGIGGSVTVTANTETASIACNRGDNDRPVYGDGCYGFNPSSQSAQQDIPIGPASKHTACWI